MAADSEAVEEPFGLELDFGEETMAVFEGFVEVFLVGVDSPGSIALDVGVESGSIVEASFPAGQLGGGGIGVKGLLGLL